MDPYTPPAAEISEHRAAPRERRFYWIRWLAVVPAAISSFAGAVAIGFIFNGVLNRFCGDELVEGFCEASWYFEWVAIGACFCAAIAAFLWVGLSSWAAPSHRRTVATLAYVAGALITSPFFAQKPSISTYGAPLSALVAGGFAVWLVFQRFQREPGGRLLG